MRRIFSLAALMWTLAGGLFASPALAEKRVAPAGSFVMGSPDDEPEREGEEGPQRRVIIPRDFAVGRYEASQAEWRSVMREASNPSAFRGDRLPVEMVRWASAKRFTDALCWKTKQTYRLLTEAERANTRRERGR